MWLPINIRRMLQKCFPCLKSNTLAQKEISSNSSDGLTGVHSISIVLHQNDAVDIILMHPDLEKFSITEISTEAEKFSELLVYTISMTMESKLLAVIAEKSKNTESIKEQLFYDNVVHYYQLIKAEFEKNLLSSGPVIRPSAAFNPK